MELAHTDRRGQHPSNANELLLMDVDLSDRRESRSPDLQRALYLQLVHTAEQFDFDAFTLSDGDGRLVATSTRSENGHDVSDLVAAFSPILNEQLGTTDRSQLASKWLNDELEDLGIGWSADEIVVREFHAGDKQLFLTAVGGTDSERELGIYRVIFGVRRIWQEAA